MLRREENIPAPAYAGLNRRYHGNVSVLRDKLGFQRDHPAIDTVRSGDERHDARPKIRRIVERHVDPILVGDRDGDCRAVREQPGTSVLQSRQRDCVVIVDKGFERHVSPLGSAAARRALQRRINVHTSTKGFFD